MSFITLNWALKLRLPPRTSSAKALLIVLSYRAKRTPLDRFECYPSIAYLADATGQNRKTIMSNLTKLQRWGLVSDTGRRMGKTRQVIVYRLHMRDGLSTGHPQKPQKTPETGPDMGANRPEISAQQIQTRDTDSFYGEDGDRCFYAHAREKDDVSATPATSEVVGSGRGSAQVQELIRDLAQLLEMPKEHGKRARTSGDANGRREGGAA
jgi:hypothetical protein